MRRMKRNTEMNTRNLDLKMCNKENIMSKTRTAGQWVDRVIIEQVLEHMKDYKELLNNRRDDAILTQHQVENFIKVIEGELK